MLGLLALGGALALSACSGGYDASTESSTSPVAATTLAPDTTTSLAAPTSPSTTAAPSDISSTTTLVVSPCGVEPVAAGDDVGSARHDSCGVAQVWVPAGTFTQGTVSIDVLDPPGWAEDELDSEQPAHEVTISTGYWIDRDEVTNAAYEAFVAAGGYQAPQYWSTEGWAWRSRLGDQLPRDCRGAPDEPRVCVTWYEAEAYAHWRGGRLPTESEWEYAARGPESSIYPWGNEWDSAKANVTELEIIAEVGSYPDGASWVGALDMAGNAMEWVSDWMSYSYYASEPSTDPLGPDVGAQKIEKGGWWGSNPYVARSAYRHFEDPPTYQDHHIGLRVLTPIGSE